jgi:large subunit ribosomal protein L17
MLSNLVTSLFENGRIQTTEAKAKEGRRLAERLVTFAKRGDLHARRQVLRTVSDKTVVKRLFDEIGPRFTDRPGGYTRIVKIGPRLGDRAPMVLFELIGEPKASPKKETKKKKEKSAQDKKDSQGTAEKKAKGKGRSKKKEKENRSGAKEGNEKKGRKKTAK